MKTFLSIFTMALWLVPAIAQTNLVSTNAVRKTNAPFRMPSLHEQGFGRWMAVTNQIGNIRREQIRLNTQSQEAHKRAGLARSAKQIGDATRYAAIEKQINRQSDILVKQLTVLEYQEMKLREQYQIADPKLAKTAPRSGNKSGNKR